MPFTGKKRILIFSTAYLPFIGGAEIAVKEITGRLPEYEFVLITARLDPELPDRENFGNLECHRVGKGNNWDKFRLLLGGAKIAHHLGPFDLVWSIMASYGGFAALRYKQRHPKIPYLLTLQEGDSRRDIYKHVWWCWRYFRQIFRRADHIQAISNYLAEWARKMGSIAPVDVIPNGVDRRQFSPPANREALRRDIRTRLQIPADAPAVISVSRLVEKNGITDLVQSFSLLPASYHLILIGTGDLSESIASRVRELGITQRVHMLGSVPHEGISPYMWASDVFCRPSRSEGLGNAFLEAMAAGLPIVATRIGGIPDFLHDEETGLFCRMSDPNDIAKKINRMISDKALAQKVIENGTRLIEKEYTWDIVTEKMKRVFASLSL